MAFQSENSYYKCHHLPLLLMLLVMVWGFLPCI